MFFSVPDMFIEICHKLYLEYDKTGNVYKAKP